jgi:hypothetical protein
MKNAMKCSSRLLGLGLAVAFAAGCGGGVRPEVLKGWVGRPAASLEKDWGVPTREVPDGDLRILVYEEVERQRAGASKFDYQDPYGNYGSNRDIHTQAQIAAEEAYRAPRVYVRSYLFWVDREGKIVHSAIRTP